MNDVGPPPPDPPFPPLPPFAMAHTQPAKKNRLPLILGIVVGAVLLCCGGGTAIVLATRGSDKPVATSVSGGEPFVPFASPPASASTAPTTAPTTLPTTVPPAEPTKAAPPPPPPVPADLVFQGRGDKVVRLKSLTADSVHYAVISHKGGSNFAVWSLDSGGDNLDLLVNEIGKYSGARPLDFEESPAALKVEADGSWKIVVKVVSKAPAWPKKTSGKGATVLVVPGGTVDGLATARVTHKGSSNFVVRAWGDSTDLLVNDIGKYSGEVLVPSGTVAIEIEADGAWTMKPS